MGGGSNDESESPRESSKNLRIRLALLSILGFGICPQIGPGPEKENGALDKSN